MKDGVVGILGTGGTIVLQEVSLWLSIVCASVTLIHFGVVFYDRYKAKGGKDVPIIRKDKEEKSEK